jgi:hypothetical protein
MSQKLNLSWQTPPGIGSFVTLLEPKANDKGEMFFSLSILFSKARTKELDPLRKLVEQAAVAMYGPNAPALMAAGTLKNPIRDGDVMFMQDAGLYKAYKGCFFISARRGSKFGKPMVIDAAKNEVFTAEDVYSGCLLRASISVFAYNKAGNKGVSFGLNNVQVLRKGERLDNRKDAKEEFAEWVDPEAQTEADPMG